MNYSELSAQIKAYCENSFPESIGSVTSADQIAQFVMNAEQRIYNTVQLPALRKNVTGTTTPSNKYVSCPTDFLAVHSLAVVDASDDYHYLLNKDVNFIREAYPSATGTGFPEYYAIFGPNSSDTDELSFILGPTPDDDYTLELHYFYYPETIVTAGTSWLGDNFDTALLYGALVEAYTYMKGEPDVIAQYEKLWQHSLSLLKQLGDGKDRRDSYRNGQVRMPVQ